jgi:hypothetical protein
MKPSKILSGVTSVDIERVMNDQREKVRLATEARDAAAAELKDQRYAMLASGDRVGEQRLQSAFESAVQALNWEAGRLEAIEQRYERAIADERAAEIEGQWQTVVDLGKALAADATVLEAEIMKMAARFVSMLEKAVLLYNTLPSKPDSVEMPNLFKDGGLQRWAAMQLFIATDGKFRIENVGDPYRLKQGPTLTHRVKDAVGIALKARPRPEPPPIAA